MRMQGLVGVTLLLAGPAFAADLDARMRVKAVPMPAAPAYNWSGFYVGGNVGGAWGDSNATTAAVAPGPSDQTIAAVGAQHINSTGFTGGGQVGYNWQLGSLVLGVETDINFLGLKGPKSASSTDAQANFTVSSSLSTNWLFTARPRIGWAANNWLFYATGGVAVGDVKGNFNFAGTPLIPPFDPVVESGLISTTKTGWAAGGGVEVGVQGPWTVKVEYLHVDLGSASTTSTNTTLGGAPFQVPFTHSIDLTANIVRAGINYKF